MYVGGNESLKGVPGGSFAVWRINFCRAEIGTKIGRLPKSNRQAVMSNNEWE